jgi:hypothetical protein
MVRRLGSNPRVARANDTRRTNRGDRSAITADGSGRPGGRCHSHQLLAQVRRPEDGRRYVVTPSNVSIDAYGLVGVSVEPVVISVPALPSAR